MTTAEGIEKIKHNLEEVMEISGLLRNGSTDEIAGSMVPLRKYVINAQQTLLNLESKLDVAMAAMEIKY